MVARPVAPDTPQTAFRVLRSLHRFAVAAALGWAALGAAATTAETAPPAARPAITNPDVVWTMTTAERELEYPLHLEGRIHFADLVWGNCWFESRGFGAYLPLGHPRPSLRAGQRVRIDGTYVPSQGLSADRIRITVLAEFEAADAVPTAGRLSELRTFDRRVVETEGYVDEQILIDDQHLRLHLIVENRAVIGWVTPDDPRQLPAWQGKWVRLHSVYSGRVDPTGTSSTIELWTARQQDVTVLRSIRDAAEFAVPVTPIARLGDFPRGTTVKLRGQIQRREIGSRLVLRDDSGEVLVETLQRQRLPAEATIEVVGRTSVAGARWIVGEGLFRRVDAATPAEEPTGPAGVLRTVGQVRQLGHDAAAQGQRVDLSGLVVWSLPEADFFYLNDLSGGVRVKLPPGRPAPALQKSIRVEGVAAPGDSGPYVRMELAHDLGSMAHPQARVVTVAHARSGSEDGQWIALRGFLQRTVSEGDWRWVHVTSPDGEFLGHLQSPVDFVATPGSLVRVQGVCEPAVSGGDRAVVLRVPFLHDITIEEDAPADPYDLPRHAIADLRQVAALRDLTRVRIGGVVLGGTRGSHLFVQEGEAAVKLITRDAYAEPGTAVEAVGILGREGARIVLREVQVRAASAAPAPAAHEITGPGDAQPGLDGRLVRIRGELVDRFDWPQHTRLTLRANDQFFDAMVPHDGGPAALAASPGAMLELTGIGLVEYDDTLQPRGLALTLRSPADVVVVVPARYWTETRLWRLVGGGAAVIVWVLVWLAMLRSRVRRQTAQIEHQLGQQAKLEAELERAQRMHSLGSLAGGLAHDFNNLLTGVLGNVTFVLNDGDLHGVHAEALREIEAGARRAKDLTAQMITFAQGGAPVRESLDLAPLLTGVAGLAFSGAATRAHMELSPELWPVFADRSQLTRAIQSVFTHARSSSPAGATVPVDATNESVATSGALAPGRYVRLTVEVAGLIVPVERLGGYFDPYVSTQYGNESFALAIAYSIVKRHGGNLEVRSSAAHGTVFRLWLPAADTPPVAPAPTTGVTRSSPAPELAGLRVLVMDDEPIIRRLTERLLRAFGCEVRTADDGAGCIREFGAAREIGRPFDVVILDLTVPGGMGGREALAVLRELDPGVRAIVSSGYFNDPVMAHYADFGFRAAVAKPYGSDVLAEAIRRVAQA